MLELGRSPAPTRATREVQNNISTMEVAPSPAISSQYWTSGCDEIYPCSRSPIRCLLRWTARLRRDSSRLVEIRRGASCTTPLHRLDPDTPNSCIQVHTPAHVHADPCCTVRIRPESDPGMIWLPHHPSSARPLRAAIPIYPHSAQHHADERSTRRRARPIPYPPHQRPNPHSNVSPPLPPPLITDEPTQYSLLP